MIDLVIAAVRDLALRGIVPRELAKRSLDSATLIDDMGMDSLGKLELMSELESRADAALSEGMVMGINTLGDLAAVLERAKEAT
jgi:acyl carrier protein